MDLCKHCIVRGDMSKCILTECNQHESWYAKHQQETISRMAGVLSHFFGPLAKDVLSELGVDDTTVAVCRCTEDAAKERMREFIKDMEDMYPGYADDGTDLRDFGDQ